MLFSHGIPNSCGTAILINNKANCLVLSTVPDLSDALLFLKFKLMIKSIYAPKKDKDSTVFFKELHSLLHTEN